MNDVFDEDLMRELGLDPAEIEAVKVPQAKKVPPLPSKSMAQSATPRPAAPAAKPSVQASQPAPILEHNEDEVPPQAKAPAPQSTRTAPRSSEDIAAYGEKMTQNIPVHLAAVLAKKTLALKDVIEMRLGEVIDFKKPMGEPIDLVVNGKLVAKAELVLVDGRIGARIVKLVR